METHSSVLAWRIPGTGEPGGLPLCGRTELDTTEVTAYFFHRKKTNSFKDPVGLYPGEGNGTPLQCSCLENPMGGGAW